MLISGVKAMFNHGPGMISVVLVAFVFAVAGLSGPVRAAQNECPEMPSVQWWGKTSHQKITGYVSSKHNGDWMPYIDKWNRQLSKMKAIYDRGGSAIFKKQGITIEDKELMQYIRAIEIRLDVTKCLALAEFERAAEEVRGMETASGDDEPEEKPE